MKKIFVLDIKATNKIKKKNKIELYCAFKYLDKN